jgi:hypothetical protein
MTFPAGIVGIELFKLVTVTLCVFSVVAAPPLKATTQLDKYQ